MAKITKIWAREILDSRGLPTIEAACQLDSGHIGVVSVPSGTSTGTYEALELRDNDPKRYNGTGVLKAVENVNKIISPALIGKDPTAQEEIDSKLISMDGTENKSKLGANAILAISEVIAKAAAMAQQQSLYTWIFSLAQRSGLQPTLKIPTPIFNMINGGLHGAGNLDFQEFHVIPSSSKTYSQGLQIGVEVYTSVGKTLERRGASHSVGHEGGYAPNLFTNADALEVIVEAVKLTPYKLGRDLLLGLDVSANNFYKNGTYIIRDKTSPLDKAIKEKACNSILIKPNQIGTITETLAVIKMAKLANWKVVVSHRSGETNDWFIVDFAVGVGADFVKFGGPARGERVAKYNRLSSIDRELS